MNLNFFKIDLDYSFDLNYFNTQIKCPLYSDFFSNKENLNRNWVYGHLLKNGSRDAKNYDF